MSEVGATSTSIGKEKRFFFNMDTLKNFLVVLSVLSVIFGLLATIAFSFWKSKVREWLSAEIAVELEKPEFRDWHYHRVHQIYSSLTPGEAEALKDTAGLRGIVREILREELSGGKLDGLAALEANHTSVVHAIMNPPAYQSLEAIVTKRVDAVYTFELYDRRSLQISIPETNGEIASQLLNGVSVSETTARFYATSDQQISILIHPSYGEDWRNAISSGADEVILKVAGQEIGVGLDPQEIDITCNIRRSLGLRDNGMVQLRAETRSRSFERKDGFQLGITIVARKGDMQC